MPNYSKHDVVLLRYPFSELTGAKVRPAVVVSGSHASQDLFVVPLTSRTGGLLVGEFVLVEWKQAGLNIETAVKRGIYTVSGSLVTRRIGKLEDGDARLLERSFRDWLGLE
jgi:mRNA interferase MazF